MIHASGDSAHPGSAGIRYLLAAVTLLIPFLYLSAVADPFQLPKQILFRIGAVLILGCWIAGILRTGRVVLRRTGVMVPLLLLAFFGLISVLQAPNTGEATALGRDLVLSILVIALALPVLEPSGGLPVRTAGVAAGVTALLGTLQMLLGARASFLPSTQGGSAAGDVTTAAFFVAIFLPLLVHLTTDPGSRLRAGWAAATGLALAHVVLSRSRPAWLAAAVGLLAFALLRLRRSPAAAGERPGSGPPVRVLPHLVGALAVAILLVLAGAFASGIRLLSAPPSLKYTELQGLALQMESWRLTGSLILSHPLGVGLGGWREAFPLAAGGAGSPSPFTSSRIPSQAGNEYLEAAAEIGPIGLILLLWLLARLLGNGWRGSAAVAGWSAAGTAGIAGLAAGSFLASPLREQPVHWGTLLLVLFSLAPRTGGDGADTPDIAWQIEPGRRKLVSALLAASFAALLLLAGWSAYRLLASEAALQEGQSAYFRGDHAPAINALLRAGRLNPSSFSARFLAGSAALEARQFDLAELELRAARRLNPHDAGTHLALAASVAGGNDLTGAVAICEKASAIWPADEKVTLALARAREAAGDLKGALEAYRRVTMANPQSVEALVGMGEVLSRQDQTFASVAAFSRAADFDPMRPDIHARLGAALLRMGNYEAAVFAFQKLLALSPEDRSGKFGLVRTYAGLGRFCEAADLLASLRDAESRAGRGAALEETLADLRRKCGRSGATGR
jgi:tetratricopeptide (TPR) repeat protein